MYGCVAKGCFSVCNVYEAAQIERKTSTRHEQSSHAFFLLQTSLQIVFTHRSAISLFFVNWLENESMPRIPRPPVTNFLLLSWLSRRIVQTYQQDERGCQIIKNKRTKITQTKHSKDLSSSDSRPIEWKNKNHYYRV